MIKKNKKTSIIKKIATTALSVFSFLMPIFASADGVVGPRSFNWEEAFFETCERWRPIPEDDGAILACHPGPKIVPFIVVAILVVGLFMLIYFLVKKHRRKNETQRPQDTLGR